MQRTTAKTNVDISKGSLSFPTYLYALSCFLAAGGDFVVTFTLGALYPGYSFVHQSESYLGTTESPVAWYMNIWGVIFCLLLVFFGYGLRKTIFRNGVWQTIAVSCVLLYGIGEGAGSGLFPYNHVNGVLTLSGKLHSVFGALGGIGITFIPFACSKIFSSETSPKMHTYSNVVFISGLIVVVVFLISREVLPFKGLWQRLFILDYHLYLSVLGIVMFRNTGKEKIKQLQTK